MLFVIRNHVFALHISGSMFISLVEVLDQLRNAEELVHPLQRNSLFIYQQPMDGF